MVWKKSNFLKGESLILTQKRDKTHSNPMMQEKSIKEYQKAKSVEN